MASDRTFVTELATALGTLGDGCVHDVVARRPAAMVNLADQDWDRLALLLRSGAHTDAFAAGFGNGQAFLGAPGALAGRRPRVVEWTGGRRPPGDEVAPSDLRIDHVYLVSCKYLSRILHNPSPARLVEGLLAQGRADDLDWYHRVAPAELQALYDVCAGSLDDGALPARCVDLVPHQRRALAAGLRAGWPDGAARSYAALCKTVSVATAAAWRARVTTRNAEVMLWRLLRIGSAPYFILGSSTAGSMRLRIDTPWDWRQAYRLRHFDIAAQPGGQPRVAWSATYEVRRTAEERVVRGHVEIRWSHGRFGQPPEAKVYLDTPHEQVPGYHPL